MDANFAVTVFTLLFAVSTARISLDHTTPDTRTSNVEKSSTLVSKSESETSIIALPTEKNNMVSERVRHVTKDNDIELNHPRSDYARFHAINRHFSDQQQHRMSSHRFGGKSRPYRHFLNPFVVPRSEVSHIDVEKYQHEVPAKRVKARHENKHHHHHHHQYHHHIHRDDRNNNVILRKHKFGHENHVKSDLVHRQEEIKAQRELGFMRSIRKFLKHTFD